MSKKDIRDIIYDCFCIKNTFKDYLRAMYCFLFKQKNMIYHFFVSRMLFFGSGENQDESLLTAFEDFEMFQFPNTVL